MLLKRIGASGGLPVHRVEIATDPNTPIPLLTQSLGLCRDRFHVDLFLFVLKKRLFHFEESILNSLVPRVFSDDALALGKVCHSWIQILVGRNKEVNERVVLSISIPGDRLDIIQCINWITIVAVFVTSRS